MKKIPTIFLRNEETRQLVTDVANPDCMWVFRGEGVATCKYDGTCCRINYGEFWKRREVKQNQNLPKEFIISGTDEITGKVFGWVPVDFDLPENKYHKEAFNKFINNEGCQPLGSDETYELCGPKIQGNPEELENHQLIAHSKAQIFTGIVRDKEGIKEFLTGTNIEGLVFHHPDGRMAKIKKRDFGMKRWALNKKQETY